MDSAHHSRPNYFVIWLWLVALATLSVLASSFLSKSVAVILIFGVAAIKALLVLLNYMHLKYEKVVISALVIVPLLVVIVLLFALFPDFVFQG